MNYYIKNILIRFSRLLPSKFRKKLLFLLNQSFRSKAGFVKEYAIFDFNTLDTLNNNNEYLDIYRKSLSKAGDESTDNIYKLLRHMNLYSYIENILVNDTQGDFAECGCWNGTSLFATKYFIDKHKSTKHIHIFDSFEGGLSEFMKEDYIGGLIKSKNEAQEVREQFSSSYPLLKRKLSKYDQISLNKGWIPEVFKAQEERLYSFVHIDVDLFEPTFESHKYFFDRLSKGGIIVCDDYGYKQFPGAAKAVDSFIEMIPKDSYSHFIKHSFGTSIIIK